MWAHQGELGTRGGGGQAVHVRTPPARRDGVYAWHLARGTPIRSEAGGVISWVGTTTDIDDLKRAQEALRGQARWLETVLESVSEGLIATGADGHIRLINSAASAHGLGGGRGSRPPARGGVSHRRRIDPPPLECPGITVLREGRVVELANHAFILARDGSERPITVGGAPIRDEDGSILGASFVSTTSRSVARPSWPSQVWRRSSSTSDDAIIGEDLDGNIIPGTTAASRIDGYSQEEVIGRSMTFLVPPDRFTRLRVSPRRCGGVSGSTTSKRFGPQGRIGR